MRMFLMILLSACLSILTLADEPKADSPTVDEEKPMSVWMEKKLEYSSAVLRGMATDDYGLIRDNAVRMQLLNRVEGFVKSRNKDYQVNLDTFKRLTSEVEQQANQQNMDGVVIAFNQLTVSCVRCHQSLRSHQKITKEK